MSTTGDNLPTDRFVVQWCRGWLTLALLWLIGMVVATPIWALTGILDGGLDAMGPWLRGAAAGMIILYALIGAPILAYRLAHTFHFGLTKWFHTRSD